MRYLLHKSQYGELRARQDYLFEIFRLYFLPGKPEGSYIPLSTLGTSTHNILFITGHTDQVSQYLESYFNLINETTIVITSCQGYNFKKYARKKDIYVPAQHHEFCLLRNGSVFGFGFDISDAELNFYNATGDAKDRLQTAYKRL